MRPEDQQALRRRTVLGLLPAGLLAACSSETPTRSAARATTATGSTPPSSTMPPTAGATPSGRVTSTTAVPPSSNPSVNPADVAARFAGARPTRWGMAMAGITQTVAAHAKPTLALTFDACGGPGGSRYDADIVGLLRSRQVPATLFLNARWIRANRALARDLISDPLFAIGNHGTRHVPLSVTGRSAYGIHGTRSAREVVDEVTGNQEVLASLMGTAPTWFRTGTAWYDDVAVDIVRALGVHVAGFAVNGDAGATASPRQVTANLRTAPSGSIVIMHLNQPGHGTFPGLREALPRLIDRGTHFVRLT